MNWKLPNQLTVGRMILAIGFFVLLGMYRQGCGCGRSLLNAAFVIFIIAGITDVLDGYLARKWNVTSAFGRIADPIMDKVLVVGAFIMLAGPNFMLGNPAAAGAFSDHDLPAWVTGSMASAVQTWMVVVILTRELIVSGVRSYSESQGLKFPATSAGKLKMFVQSVAICTSLYQQANVPAAAWAIYLKVTCIWLAVAITVISGLTYIGKARKLLLSTDE